MPITPLHGLAFTFLYFKDKQHVDPLALIVSTTFIDLEPLYYKLLALYGKVRINPIKVKYPLLNIYLLCLFGGFTHVFLDMFTHDEMFWVLYPLTYGNPFYMGPPSTVVEVAVILLTLYSLKCWMKDKPVNLGIKNSRI